MSAGLEHWLTLAILAVAALVVVRRGWIALRAARATTGACTACGCAQPASSDRMGRRTGETQ